ncbi:hypothetical protein [Alteromonas stellipolaris]|uniref:Uncharacterized protein n=1 Tax=Alteromonas stellipolaris TaxID=233316 RepID=A0ABN4LTH9_9ALTE|nr:hypothetical protein AVL57_00835 [Alteromonas stellipolaris]
MINTHAIFTNNHVFEAMSDDVVHALTNSSSFADNYGRVILAIQSLINKTEFKGVTFGEWSMKALFFMADSGLRHDNFRNKLAIEEAIELATCVYDCTIAAPKPWTPLSSTQAHT